MIVFVELVRIQSLSETTPIEATVKAGSPSAPPAIHGVLIHLSGHEVIVGQLLGQPELLIGLVFRWCPHVRLVGSSSRLHIKGLALPWDQRELTFRQGVEQLLLLRRIRGNELEAGRG